MERDMEYFRLITNMNYKAKNMFTELNICWTVLLLVQCILTDLMRHFMSAAVVACCNFVACCMAD